MTPPKVGTSPLLRGSLRGLVQLLALLMVPVLVVATPTVANAATVYGDWGGATVVADGLLGDTSCKINARYVDGADFGVEVANSVCLSPVGGFQGGSSYSLIFKGMQDGTTSPCSVGGSGVATEHEDDKWTNELTRLEHATYTVYPYAKCSFNTVCWEAGRTAAKNFCATISLPPPVAPSGSCAYGNLSNAWTSPMTVGARTDGVARSTTMWQPAKWYMVYVHRRATDGVIYVKNDGIIERTISAPQATLPAYEYTVPDPIIGIQVTRITATVTRAAADTTYRGVTDPANCMWYVGEKIANRPGDTLDEPWSTLTTTDTGTPDTNNDTPPGETAPVEEPSNADNCTFSWSDPTTWASAGICAVVHLLSVIWNTLKAIPAAVLDGLQGLFVPPSGYMDAKSSKTRADLNQTTPAKWLDAFDGLGSGSVTGCEGIPFKFEMRGKVYVDDHIGAACSGQSASVASLVRIAISAMVVIGGGLACIRALGSGFGWDPNVGTRGGGSV